MKLTYLATIGVLILTSFQVHSEEAKQSPPPNWQVQDENKLCGIWLNTNPKTQSIPKVEIFREGASLMIRFWGRTHPQDTPLDPPDSLYVLSDDSEPEKGPQKQPSAIAFATRKAAFAIKHFTLRLFDGELSIEGVTLFTDDSKRSNRIMIQTFEKKKDNAEGGGGQPATRPKSK